MIYEHFHFPNALNNYVNENAIFGCHNFPHSNGQKQKKLKMSGYYHQ